jgi:hypothetical protein
MNRDIRLDVDFWDHPKTIRLCREFGQRGPEYIQRLWLYAAKYHPNGILEGDDSYDIAVICHYEDDPDAFVSRLVELRWIDMDGSPHYSLHNWEKRNPWASRAEERSLIASKAAHVMHSKRLHIIKDAQSMQKACVTHAKEENEHANHACTEHAPSPSPLPKEKKNARAREDIPKSKKIVKLPDWINRDLWKEFKNHRKAKKAPMTEYAEILAINHLEKFKLNGSDPDKVVKRSIEMGWTGLFELPPEQRQSVKQKPSNQETAHKPDANFPNSLLDVSKIYDEDGNVRPEFYQNTTSTN